MKDGGRAFPHSYEVMPDKETHIHHGMTLRDWFAGMAMQGMLARKGQFHPADAYEAADAIAKAEGEQP